VSPLARQAITVAKQGSGGGRFLRGFGGKPITTWELADVWAALPPESADACWARLAAIAAVPVPKPEERKAVLDELRGLP
jgi:hypothetical protein